MTRAGTGPLVHIVTGGTGAGKTHYSIALAESLRGKCFSIDDWMTTLFWMDAPQPPSFEWAMDRIGRCEAQIRTEVRALAELGVPSVLDLGFTKAEHREAFAYFAEEIGAGAQLHWVDVPTDVRWSRVQDRNLERGATYAMDVDRAMFDFMESEWEAPSQEELARWNGQVIRA